MATPLPLAPVLPVKRAVRACTLAAVNLPNGIGNVIWLKQPEAQAQTLDSSGPRALAGTKKRASELSLSGLCVNNESYQRSTFEVIRNNQKRLENCRCFWNVRAVGTRKIIQVGSDSKS